MSNNYSNFGQDISHLIKKKTNIFAKSNLKKAQNKKYMEKNSDDSENNINVYETQLSLKKKKKLLYIPKDYNVRKKKYYKEGKSIEFDLYKEKEIGLDGWNEKINILESEEDYDSDENVIFDGKLKSKNDLSEALKMFSKNKFKEIQNYEKYCKYK